MTHIEEGLDFILSHFQEPIWPRAISSKTTECRQILVDNRKEALARFKQANYLDCRVSAYGPNVDENQSAVDRFQGIMTATPANIIVMVDLDRCNFNSERILGQACSSNPQKYQREVGCGHTYGLMVWSRLSCNTTIRYKRHNT